MHSERFATVQPTYSLFAVGKSEKPIPRENIFSDMVCKALLSESQLSSQSSHSNCLFNCNHCSAMMAGAVLM